jgi:hypothetical protein
MAADKVPAPFPFAQGKQFIPEDGGEQDRTPRLSPVRGLDDAAGPPGLHNAAHRGGV